MTWQAYHQNQRKSSNHHFLHCDCDYITKDDICQPLFANVHKMFTIQNRAEKKEKETKKADVSPYNPLLSKEINKKKEKNITWNIYILRLTSYINIYYIL